MIQDASKEYMDDVIDNVIGVKGEQKIIHFKEQKAEQRKTE